MELKGKIIQVLPIVTGQGKSKPWAKQDFILETPGQYPKKVAMSVWGEENINKLDLAPELVVTAHIDIESREHNGKWYTEVKAYKVTWDSQQFRKWQP